MVICYSLSEGGRVTRVHGAFVSDSEVERIVSHIRKQENPDYIDEIVEEKDEKMIYLLLKIILRIHCIIKLSQLLQMIKGYQLVISKKITDWI